MPHRHLIILRFIRDACQASQDSELLILIPPLVVDLEQLVQAADGTVGLTVLLKESTCSIC